MRKLLALVALVACTAALAAGIVPDQSVQKTFTDCASGGSSAQTVAGGTYLLTVTDENTWLCQADSASTCASGGIKLPLGTVMLYGIARSGQSVSCRSSSSGGDLQFTFVAN